MAQRQLENFVKGFKEYLSSSESSPLFVTWGALSTIAATTRRRIWYEFGHKKVFTNMWVLLVGPPGVRKSDAIDVSRDILRKCNKVHISAESLTREYLLDLFAEIRDKHILELSQTMPPEAAAAEAISDLTVHSSEFGVFLGQSDTRFINDLTDLFDCKDSWEYATLSRGRIVLNNGWLNIFGAITPAAIRTLIPDFAIGGGFLSRFILVCDDKKRKRISIVDLEPSDKKLLLKLTDDAQDMCDVEGKLSLTPQAKEIYRNWYESFEETEAPGEDQRLVHYNQRKPMHTLKVAALFSLAKDNSLVVGEEDIQAALALLERTEESMKLAVSGVGSSRLAYGIAEVEVIVRKARTITYKLLHMSTMHNLTKTDLDEIISSLRTSGAIYMEIVNGEKILSWRQPKRKKPADSSSFSKAEICKDVL